MQVCGRPDARNGSEHINSTKVIRLVSTFTSILFLPTEITLYAYSGTPSSYLRTQRPPCPLHAGTHTYDIHKTCLYIYAHKHEQTYTHMNIYNMHKLTNAYEHAYMHMHKHFYARTQHICMHVHTCTHKHIHTYPFTFTDTHRGRQIKSSQMY